MGDCHATITPDRVDKRQNGRRAKPDEEPMFTLTAQDLHGVIVDDTYGYEQKDRVYKEASPTLRQSRQGVKVIEGNITEVCVNDRGFSSKPPQVSNVVPTLRAENHGNHPKVIENMQSEICKETGLLDPEGVGKTLRVGGGVADEEAQLPARLTKGTGVKHVGAIVSKYATKLDRLTDVIGCIQASDYKGFGNQQMNAVLEVRNERENNDT